ncbi:unnamed protein product [Onchocerca ochengi]|uniref:Helitron_like_N domain-containing protein n=1 Tax=Onchocerca ochengi TaxID=42157 RepID=A0A182EQ32_ONCOC|nr:unnamed protein product [Onchocerca ochengi]
MYFIGDSNDELNARCRIHTDIEPKLIHKRNNLVCLFKTTTDMMPSDTQKIVIHGYKTLAGEYIRRFNVPTIDEVAIVVVGDQFEYMFAKIETERLIFIRLNQTKLFSEEFIHIHLRDATVNDGNTIGRLRILLSPYASSPHHVHEYAQNAIADVRQYTGVQTY